MSETTGLSPESTVVQQQTTIADILARRNPLMNDVRRHNRHAPQATKGPQLLNEALIIDWSDFNFRNIHHAFGNVLEMASTHNAADSPAEYRITTHGDFASAAETYLGHLLMDSIRLGHRVLSGHRDNDRSTIAIVTEGNLGKMRPTMLIKLNGQDPANLVVGFALRSSWCPKDLTKINPKSRTAFYPVDRAINYALLARTKYAFLLTPEEIVVFRIFGDARSGYGAQWQVVPWTAEGPNVLTVGMAIWALVMFALDKDQRAIEANPDPTPLNVWWRVKRNGGVVYKHHLSARELPYLPAGAVARNMPVP